MSAWLSDQPRPQVVEPRNRSCGQPREHIGCLGQPIGDQLRRSILAQPSGRAPLLAIRASCRAVGRSLAPAQVEARVDCGDHQDAVLAPSGALSASASIGWPDGGRDGCGAHAWASAPPDGRVARDVDDAIEVPRIMGDPDGLQVDQAEDRLCGRDVDLEDQPPSRATRSNRSFGWP